MILHTIQVKLNNNIIYNTISCVGKPQSTLFIYAIHLLYICVQREITGNTLTQCHPHLGIQDFGWFVVFVFSSYSFIFLELLCIVLATFKIYTQ